MTTTLNTSQHLRPPTNITEAAKRDTSAEMKSQTRSMSQLDHIIQYDGSDNTIIQDKQFLQLQRQFEQMKEEVKQKPSLSKIFST